MARRVIAIQSLKDGVLNIFGYGDYIGDKVPNCEPYNEIKVTNPCIRLDNGKYVWGFQSWWADVDKFENKYSKEIKERHVVEIDENIEPVRDDANLA